MRKSLNLDNLKSELVDLTINKKTYKVGAIPLGYLMKMVASQEEKLSNEDMLIKSLDIASDIIKIENPDFEREELDKLDVKKALELIRWMITSTDKEDTVKNEKKNT